MFPPTLFFHFENPPTLNRPLHLRVAGEGRYGAMHVTKASSFSGRRALAVGIALSTCVLIALFTDKSAQPSVLPASGFNAGDFRAHFEPEPPPVHNVNQVDEGWKSWNTKIQPSEPSKIGVENGLGISDAWSGDFTAPKRHGLPALSPTGVTQRLSARIRWHFTWTSHCASCQSVKPNPEVDMPES